MVRTPCCKAELGLKKGAWTPKEDQKLVSYVTLHGEGGWRTLPERAGLKRCGKSCRLRWANYLRPNIKRGEFKEDEERYIISLHALHGNKWAAIARELPGRTDNEIKNYWNTRIIKKHLIKKGIDPVTHKGLIISDTEKPKYLLEKQKSYNDDDDIDNDKAKYSNKKSPSAKFLNRVANVFGKTNNTSVMSEIINRSGGPLITTSQTITTTTTTTNTSVTVDSESDKSTSSPFTPISNLLYSSTSSDSSLPLMYCEDHDEDNVGFSSFLSDEDFMMLEESCVENNYEFMRKRARFDATSFYENQDVFQEIDNFLHERNF